MPGSMLGPPHKIGQEQLQQQLLVLKAQTAKLQDENTAAMPIDKVHPKRASKSFAEPPFFPYEWQKTLQETGVSSITNHESFSMWLMYAFISVTFALKYNKLISDAASTHVLLRSFKVA